MLKDEDDEDDSLLSDTDPSLRVNEDTMENPLQLHTKDDARQSKVAATGSLIVLTGWRGLKLKINGTGFHVIVSATQNGS